MKKAEPICRICGRPLSAHVSVERSMGPVCAGKHLNDALRDDQYDMFGADFDYDIEGNILLIYDLNFGNRSVTNDMENVLRKIQRQEQIDLQRHWIAYQDSQGIFDGVSLANNRVQFYHIGTRDKHATLRYFRIDS